MAYKVGTTIVIDDTGFVDWSRIANTPEIGTGSVSTIALVNGTPTSGQGLGGSVVALGGGDGLVRQLPVYRPIHRCLEEGDPCGPEVYARAANVHPQHRQLQLQL